VPDQDLIIVDLSTSLTAEQRQLIPKLVKTFVISDARNAYVTVYPLVSDLGNSDTLVRHLRPPENGRRVVVADWEEFVINTWSTELEASVKKVLDLPKLTQDRIYTSCYIASAVFADQYFAHVSSAGRLRLLWVGDLIEDCPLPEYQLYRLPNKGSADRVGSLRLSLGHLGNVAVIGAVIARDPLAKPSDAPFVMTTNYWHALAPRLGITENLFTLGPAGVALRPTPPTQTR
jgi:hypothetical protein